MSPRDATPIRPYAAWARSWWPTLALIFGVVLVRLLYLAFACPYALIEDEAHYWEWARRPALSYYTKGPGVAWVIAATTSIIGDTAFGVRAGAALFGAIAAYFIARLAREVSGDHRAGFFAAAIFHLVPLFQALGILMTIDGPYVACWAAACFYGYRALARGSFAGWPLLGLTLGLGFLFKYTMLLLPPALALYAWMARGRVERSPRAALGLLTAVIAFGLAISPVLIWNAQEGWPTVRHLLGHLGLPGGDVPPDQSQHASGYHYSPAWTLEFVGVQLVLVGPALLLALYSAGRAWRAHEGDDRWPRRLFLIVMAAPMLLFYLGVSFLTRVEGNWPAAGYVTLVALAGWGVVDAMTTYGKRVARWERLPEPRPKRGILRAKPETHRQIAWHFTIGYGLIAGHGMLRADWLAPGAARVLSIIKDEPVEASSMIGRLTSAPGVARSIQTLREKVESQTGAPPLLIGQHYGRASQLAFYLPDQPLVYCASSYMVGRRTQYDYWPDTDLGDLERLGGRTAVLIGGTKGQWEDAFGVGNVDYLGDIEGDHKRGRYHGVGHGYIGFPRDRE
ncbi:MAG: glycosyltransferase family 39 protein [Planctomycetota bacterium]